MIGSQFVTSKTSANRLVITNSVFDNRTGIKEMELKNDPHNSSENDRR